MTLNKVMVDIFGLTEQSMMETGNKENVLGTASVLILMVVPMKANFKIISSMEEVNSSIKTLANI